MPHIIKRSYNMSMIKGKDTKPEMLVRRFLFGNGFRYRVNLRGLPGKPDIVLRKYGVVIFINGCFWHGHENCKYFKIPKTRSDWWQDKIERNIKRDAKVRDELRQIGWRTMVVWECQLKPKVIDNTLKELAYLLDLAYLEKLQKKKKQRL
ncbi:MAG: DNA mismatch endonuclease Vsr [Tepidanaerobacteraceae bacterium]|nr:DNA mismatch endonuclease Vsr [Tepidanaerobacteraceae bacterium]